MQRWRYTEAPKIVEWIVKMTEMAKPSYFVKGKTSTFYGHFIENRKKPSEFEKQLNKRLKTFL